MILLIDNYDSFSYNLVQLIGQINSDIRVIRNDELTIEQIDALKPEAIIISPGPGRPAQAGVCIELVRRLGDKYKILGVCLGHQAICEAYGAMITYAKQLMHGKQSVAKITTDSKLFRGLGDEIKVARYHSLAADYETLSDELMITAVTADNEIMAVEHKRYKVFGLQFHPESILTPDGRMMIENFLKL